jgi:hypothetical protein
MCWAMSNSFGHSRPGELDNRIKRVGCVIFAWHERAEPDTRKSLEHDLELEFTARHVEINLSLHKIVGPVVALKFDVRPHPAGEKSVA